VYSQKDENNIHQILAAQRRLLNLAEQTYLLK
jgi:hypothetical protein